MRRVGWMAWAGHNRAWVAFVRSSGVVASPSCGPVVFTARTGTPGTGGAKMWHPLRLKCELRGCPDGFVLVGCWTTTRTAIDPMRRTTHRTTMAITLA